MRNARQARHPTLRLELRKGATPSLLLKSHPSVGGIGQKPPVDLCELYISDVTIRLGDGVCVERIIDLIRAVRRA